jgi:hypothetical protein
MDEEPGDRSAPLTSGFSRDAASEAEARAEARLIVRAFSRLPERWRTVLWHLEVEGKTPADVAPMFGLSGNGVSALAMRAREGLRQAYLQEHIGTNIPASCRAYAEDLGAGARGRLSPRRQAAMQDHLGQCPGCQDLFTELSELNHKLGTILAPIALAGTSAVLHGGRHALLRAGLSAHWRTMRWHPVTAAAGAAASVAVAGGMLFAVNITPLPGAPSHVAVQPAGPTTNSGTSADHRADRRRGGGGGGGGSGSAGGTLTGSGTPAGGAPHGAAGPAPLTGTAPLTGLTGTVDDTVTGLAGTAGSTVGSLAGTAAAAVTGVTNTAVATLSGVTGTVAGVTSTAGATVSGVASTVGGTADTATAGVASTAASTGSAVSGAVTGAAATVSGTVSTASTTAASTGGTVTAAVTGVVGAALG